MKTKVLQFKWTISRGYNICSLYVDGKKVSGCSGGGYDMMGTCLGAWIQKEFAEELKSLEVDKYYGLR
jgi:hypothetical protein